MGGGVRGMVMAGSGGVVVVVGGSGGVMLLTPGRVSSIPGTVGYIIDITVTSYP